MRNPLVSDAFIDFVLSDVVDLEGLLRLPHFSSHTPDTVSQWLASCRQVAREVLWPTYRAMDLEPPQLREGQVFVHRSMPACWKALCELGVLSASRPAEVGGHQVPLTVSTLAHAYVMAGNLSAFGFAGLTAGAAHLVEAFAPPATRALFLERMLSGEWTGTMALTEPQAGSSLADVQTRATRLPDGTFGIEGSKIFISAGDHDLTPNIVHLALARIDGAPSGTRGLSLFAVPKRHPLTAADNDVSITGLIHKIGWKGLPSVALTFGEQRRCQGWLVGAENEGLRCMFQMMNEARLMVGVNAAATASVAFHESLAYARERQQGRPLGAPSTGPQVTLTEHPDVRRMLLRQKAIVEGSLALIALTARFADVSVHGQNEDERASSKLLLDLLTPIAKTFPSERGFEANALSLQLHGGYGYSSEFLPEAFLRDQKLNSIHEGTTTIQGLDLLGRKAIAGQGAAMAALEATLRRTIDEARAREVYGTSELATALNDLLRTTGTLGLRGMNGDVVGMLAHSADYLDLASTVVMGWVWLMLSTRVAGRTDALAQGLSHTARYWLATEVPRAAHLSHLCESNESSYLDVRDEWLG